MNDYEKFLKSKTQSDEMSGFEPLWMPDFLFDFQQSLCSWSIRKGKAAILADCGMGKSPVLLVWAENVVRKTNKPVLVITPLAVTYQMEQEGKKFGIKCVRSSDGKFGNTKIVVTNYDRIHYFNSEDFAGVVCDEVSCLKAADGERRQEVTEFLRTRPYRLLCTATAAPNDYIEIGTLSEALGVMGQRDMITAFFTQDTEKEYLGWGRTKYRMKGHAEKPFWRWVCSWARACRKPSDLGFKDDDFKLPPLIENFHIIQASPPPKGLFFRLPSKDMREERKERRRTIVERCEKMTELVAKHDCSMVWCHLNDEGDLLQKLIPNSMQVKGSDSDEHKENAVKWFIEAKGKKRLISKPVMFGYGLNLQHCSHIASFISHSYEQYYQALRRCWRFGQKNEVEVDFVITESEKRILKNLTKKAKAADTMFTHLVENMNNAMVIKKDKTKVKIEVPEWAM